MSKVDLSKLSAIQLGDYGESFFATEALKRGLCISKPFGSQEGFDFVVAKKDKFIRVQVKCISKYMTITPQQKSIARITCRKPRKYDVLVCIDLIKNQIAIVPVSDLAGEHFYMGSKKNAKYINAWHLLK